LFRLPDRRIAMGESAGEQALSRLHSVRERIGDSLSAHTNELVAVFSRSVRVIFCRLEWLAVCRVSAYKYMVK
jgi:hypothetical protein